MDTPQVTPGLLATGLRALNRPGVDTVLGPALDGGFWSIGLNDPSSPVFTGVPMSADDTCTEQRRRIRALGLSLDEQPALRDVDTFADARAVAAGAPATRFAATLAAL